ncbi:lytic transglycosylase domain-containing protein [Luteimonas vadosa]|uniref:Lytic transglycosylase domain-containing protein n=1 Tax=Luteimonas vadosa TaxID=1165507 RepID=A0ABP9DY51_9GAMM
MRSPARAALLALSLYALALPAFADPGDAVARAEAVAHPPPAGIADPTLRSGREIFDRFREGLAEPECETDASTRWSKHFSHVPRQLAHGRGDVLPLFGYVVDAMRDAGLPTEYALIPFVESGYKPGARSASGPAGLWQFIQITARNHKIAIRPGYDGRLSPVDATRAAVRYLKTLHGMFAGDWRLAVMAYNAGEYRVFGALKRHGQRARDARPDQLASLPSITRAYVRKLHALSCVLAAAEDREQWVESLDRKVPRLVVLDLPPNVDSLRAWSDRQGLDAAVVERLNPAFPKGRLGRVAAGSSILVPAGASPKAPAIDPVPGSVDGPVAMDASPAAAAEGSADAAAAATSAPAATMTTARRTHTVARGESAWLIARRYAMGVAELLSRNGLDHDSTLQPGMVLELDADRPGPGANQASVAN